MPVTDESAWQTDIDLQDTNEAAVDRGKTPVREFTADSDVDKPYMADTHQEKLSFSSVAPVDVHIRGLNVQVEGGGWSWLPSRQSRVGGLGVEPPLEKTGRVDLEGQGEAHKRILRDIDADFPHATLTGIIGSSGSGKTTLLNVLSHRMRSSNLHITGSLFPLISSITHAYVTQTDVLLPTLTVRETLQYAAELRLPSSISSSERSQLVEEIILELGLKECANTMVGDGHRRRGCSGGERRRVSLGVQMLGNPSVLFLDEPTTGLDATSAYQLVKTLQSIASKGRTVIMTLHQPRTEVFAMLDRITLLSKGSVLYSGERDGAVPWFEGCSGRMLEAHVNPAEYLIGMGAGVLSSRWRESAAQRFPPVQKQTLSADTTRMDSMKAPLRRTVFTLVSRTLKTSFRDPMGLTTSWIEAALMGVVVGLVFLRLPESLAGIRSREAAAYTAVGLQGYLMVMFEVYRLTVVELPVFDRENSEGVVGVIPWLLSYRLSHLFLEDAIVPFIFAVITYWMMGFAADAERFGVYFGVVLMSQFTSVTFAALAGGVTRDFGAATLVANLAYTVHTFACGFFVQAERIPIWLRWLKWTSQVFYGFTAIAYNEFHDRFYACPASPSSPDNPECLAYTGEFVLTSLAIPMVKDSWRTVPLLAMLGIALVYLSGSALLLAFKKVDVAMLGRKEGKDIGGGGDSELVKDDGISGAKATELRRAQGAGKGVDVALEGYTLHIRKRELKAGLGKTPSGADSPSGKKDEITAESKTILNGITTTFEAGKVNVILGPSGSGKSSLLNAMAERLESGWRTQYDVGGRMELRIPPLHERMVSGGTSTDSTPGPPQARAILPASALQSVCSYVTQDDAALLPYLTVRETLSFAAVLRLPESMSRREKHIKAEEVMMRMGLGDCADTLVGGEGVKGKGISGGERRRVSIAVQVLTEPSVLILDEPTSGLDAATAASIMSVLTSLAHVEGRTVVTTLHQSSSSLFSAFDNVLLLSKGGSAAASDEKTVDGSSSGGGRVIYSGRADGMLPWLEAAGWPCPRQMNPADFALDVVSVDLREAGREEESRARVGALGRKWADRERMQKMGRGDEKGGMAVSGEQGHAAVEWKTYEKRMSSMSTSLPILLKRGWLAFKRQQTLPEARIGNVMGLGIVSAIFFSPLGNDYVSVQNRIGCLQEILPLYFVGMLQNIAVYPMERDIFYREYSDGAYSLESFFLSYLLLELPCEIIASLLFSTLAAIATNLTRTVPFFFITALNAMCIVNAGESLGIIFNTLPILHSNTGLAMNVTNVVLSVSMCMAGLMSVDQPGFLKGVNYISPLRYVVRNLVPWAFRDQVFGCVDREKVGGECVLGNGEDVLRIYELNGADPGINLGVLVAVVVVYRLLAYVVLKVRKTGWGKR